jgi:long-chain acyl-CoA synthetase
MEEIRTLTDLFRVHLARGKAAVLLEKRDGAWREISAAETERSVRALSFALTDLGLREGDRVAILMENRPEWLFTDYATLVAGGVTVPLYPTLTAEQIARILRDSGTSFVFASNPAQLEKILAVWKECPDLVALVLVDDAGLPVPEEVLRFDSLLERGNASATLNPALWERRIRARKPDDLATIIYTSGTTGEPKGVELTHRNIVANIEGCLDVVEFGPNWTAISFLPLSHVYERMVDYAYFQCGLTIAYAESIEKLGENFLEVRPHVFVAVPRVYEKIHAKILAGVESSGFRRRIFGAALRTAKEHFAYVERGEKPPFALALRWKFFDRIAYRKVKDRLGGRFQFCLSGGAPLAPELADFFGGMGIRVLEGYGMTESSPVIATNTPECWRNGTVGKPLPNLEVRIAEDGEILVRGPSIMRGYRNRPDETKSVLSDDGWLATGDVGRLDAEGFLVITDRKKEIIVDAYGKNIAPQRIENLLKARPSISQAVVIGDRRPFVSALVVPDFQRCRAEMFRLGVRLEGNPEIAAHPEVYRLVQNDVHAVNEELAQFEQIKRIALLPTELTQERGELTPTLKVKRRVIAERFAPLIESLYEGHSSTMALPLDALAGRTRKDGKKR